MRGAASSRKATALIEALDNVGRPPAQNGCPDITHRPFTNLCATSNLRGLVPTPTHGLSAHSPALQGKRIVRVSPMRAPPLLLLELLPWRQTVRKLPESRSPWHGGSDGGVDMDLLSESVVGVEPLAAGSAVTAAKTKAMPAVISGPTRLTITTSPNRRRQSSTYSLPTVHKPATQTQSPPGRH